MPSTPDAAASWVASSLASSVIWTACVSGCGHWKNASPNSWIENGPRRRREAGAAELLAVGNVPDGAELFRHAGISTFDRVRGGGTAGAVGDVRARGADAVRCITRLAPSREKISA